MTEADGIIPDASDDKPERDFSMRVLDVTGRGSANKDGLAAFHSMSLGAADGRSMTFRRIQHPNRATAQVMPILLAELTIFDRCPICLTPNPESREHVPPDALGGNMMTLTCSRCNNQFGSLVETELIDWFEDAYRRVTFSHADVRGQRRSSRVLLRTTGDGKPVIMPESYFDDEIGDKLEVGANFEFTYETHDMARVRLAALKNAYLGACLATGAILETPEAVQVRAELMAVRDLRRRDPVPRGPAAKSIRFGRSETPATGDVMLVQATPSDGSAPHFAVTLSGVLLVSWVFGGFMLRGLPDGSQQAVQMEGITVTG